MLKPRSKQIVITELEASTINDLLKEKIIQIVRNQNGDWVSRQIDLDMIVRMQKRYEDIVKYIRSKENEN